MNAAEWIVKLLEMDENHFIFGHPGEQILPFYKALSSSSIKHVLTRHEQAAAHAADAYARSSSHYGICLSTIAPGAMNLVMGVSVAFKDSVPMLVITGDNDYFTKGSDIFQSFPTNAVFENITIKSFHPSNGREAIYNLFEALVILHRFPKGPLHINLSRDVLLEDLGNFSLADNLEEIFDSFDSNIFDLTDFEDYDSLYDDFSLSDDFSLENIFSHFHFYDNSLLCHSKFDDFSQKLLLDVDNDIELAIKMINLAEKPLVVVGNGVVWSKSIIKLTDYLSKTKVPIATTYHSKGIISEYDKLNLGIVGIRGNSLSNYAFENADLVLVLGAKLSERTLAGFDLSQKNVIHVNIDESCLKGDINVCMDVSLFLDILLDSPDLGKVSTGPWLDEIYSHYEEIIVDGVEDVEDNFNPLRPPYAINKIVDAFKGVHIVSDAGTHTTWTTLFSKNDSFGKLLFSGGFAPMGYGLAGAIGVAFALKTFDDEGGSLENNDKVLVICGDGDIQMVIQELATIKEYGLNIAIFIIDNSQLGIIRQWEEDIYDFDRFEVDLINPDFKKLANAYGIDSMRVESKEDLELAINKSLSSNKAFLADVCVCEENIPLPKK